MISPSDRAAVSFTRGPEGLYRLEGGGEGLSLFTAGKAANPTGYGGGSSAAREEEKEFIASVTRIERARIILLDQVHGDAVLDVNGAPREDRPVFGTGDGLITTLPGVCLVIRTADCVPVFVFDPHRGVLGAAHSGWRGARLGIAGTLVREMGRRHGCRAGDLRAYILPSIGPASYEVGRDVADLFPEDARARNGALFLDLWGNIERALTREGVPPEGVFNARVCTLERRYEFYSYRGGDEGRNLNFGYIGA